jgi:hypothetical protein
MCEMASNTFAVGVTTVFAKAGVKKLQNRAGRCPVTRKKHCVIVVGFELAIQLSSWFIMWMAI